MLNLDTSAKIASLLVQLQLDHLGIDYIDKRQQMIAAVTLDDAQRVAKRLFGGGMLVTVVGRPAALASAAASPGADSRPRAARRCRRPCGGGDLQLRLVNPANVVRRRIDPYIAGLRDIRWRGR